MKLYTLDMRRAFIEGMELSMRICRNRAADYAKLDVTQDHKVWREQEAKNCAAMIRIVQVNIGAERIDIPDFTLDEIEEMERIS